MNHEAVLALLGDLYSQVAALQADNAQLREALAATRPQAEGGTQ